ITPDVASLVEGYIEVRPRGPVDVKGFAEPVPVYEIVGVGRIRTRFQAAAQRGLAPFVGRDMELEHLRRALERAGAGRGQVVALIAEAGVGKSRLVWEFQHSPAVEGWLVLEGHSLSYDRARSYLPLVGLLK